MNAFLSPKKKTLIYFNFFTWGHGLTPQWMWGIRHFQTEGLALRLKGADSPPNCLTVCYKLPQCLLDVLKKPAEPHLLQKAEMHFCGSQTGFSPHMFVP